MKPDGMKPSERIEEIRRAIKTQYFKTTPGQILTPGEETSAYLSAIMAYLDEEAEFTIENGA